ncbi:gamma-glutamylcyclotransferase [Acidocella sp.]|uniref:gamma-glutamylcyclotransferase n=1 Tax=Acidocella sp. TaxID=50710 RepID=UPI00262B57A1|nr:gamma-glutamylcyclotransferase [Acidocella sp.]
MKLQITRETLKDGTVREMQRLHANAHPDMKWRTEAEMAELFEQVMAQHKAGEDLWLFGYGSLIWNPAFEYVETRCVLLRGWHRRFCLKMYMGRGTIENPGLMLALDRGGACRGLAFRIAAGKLREELGLVWQREMYGGSYNARWVTLLHKGKSFKGLTFVSNHSHPRYTRELSLEQSAAMIARAHGELGTCREYLENTIAHLAELGVRDVGLMRIARALPKPAR